MKLGLQPREKILTTAVLLLLTVYCFYNGWYRPYNQKINTARAELAKTKINLNRARTLQDAGQNYSAVIKTLESDAAVAERQLPGVPALPYVLGYVRDTFENNEVALKNISCTKGNSRPADDRALEYRTAKITFCGTYPQIVLALRNLETSDWGTLTVSDLTLVKFDNSLFNGSAVIGMYFRQHSLNSNNKPVMGEKGKFPPIKQ